MKIYAELIGNYKNYRIKSLQGNILMSELADEELHDLSPRAQEQTTVKFQDIGYYYDENGIKRYGVIPDKKKFQTSANSNWIQDYSINRTSDPRYK